MSALDNIHYGFGHHYKYRLKGAQYKGTISDTTVHIVML